VPDIACQFLAMVNTRISFAPLLFEARQAFFQVLAAAPVFLQPQDLP
jgi:hypothetical protein